MENVEVAISLAAMLLSLASFLVAMLAAAQAKKAETIKNLLGSKETVAFAALKLLRDGLPRNKKERKLIVSSLVQACVFSSSDRSRALLYMVVATQRARHRSEFESSAAEVQASFQSMEKYDFSDEDLDLARGNRRLAALNQVIRTTSIVQKEA